MDASQLESLKSDVESFSKINLLEDTIPTVDRAYELLGDISEIIVGVQRGIILIDAEWVDKCTTKILPMIRDLMTAFHQRTEDHFPDSIVIEASGRHAYVIGFEDIPKAHDKQYLPYLSLETVLHHASSVEERMKAPSFTQKLA